MPLVWIFLLPPRCLPGYSFLLLLFAPLVSFRAFLELPNGKAVVPFGLFSPGFPQAPLRRSCPSTEYCYCRWGNPKAGGNRTVFSLVRRCVVRGIIVFPPILFRRRALGSTFPGRSVGRPCLIAFSGVDLSVVQRVFEQLSPQSSFLRRTAQPCHSRLPDSLLAPRPSTKRPRKNRRHQTKWCFDAKAHSTKEERNLSTRTGHS